MSVPIFILNFKKNRKKMDNRSMSERLKSAGIETIGEYKNGTREDQVFLKYKEKTIVRPPVQNCVAVCKKEFGIKI